MAEDLAACNKAFEELKKEFPDANYFEFLKGFNAGCNHRDEEIAEITAEFRESEIRSEL